MTQPPARARSVLVATGGASGAIAVFVLGVLTARGQRIEQAILDAASFSDRSPLLSLVTVPGLVAACAVLALIAVVRRRPAAGVAAVGLVAVSNVLGQLLKYEILDRPALTVEATNTFPSGHMIAFASVLLASLLVLPPRARLVVAPAATAVLCLVGVEMIRFGWHRPSDIAGSLCLVVALAAVARLCAGRAVARSPGPATERMTAVLAVLGIATSAAAATVGLLHATRLLPAATWSLTSFGYGVVLGLAPLAVAAGLWLVAGPAGRTVDPASTSSVELRRAPERSGAPGARS